MIMKTKKRGRNRVQVVARLLDQATAQTLRIVCTVRTAQQAGELASHLTAIISMHLGRDVPVHAMEIDGAWRILCGGDEMTILARRAVIALMDHAPQIRQVSTGDPLYGSSDRLCGQNAGN